MIFKHLLSLVASYVALLIIFLLFLNNIDVFPDHIEIIIVNFLVNTFAWGKNWLELFLFASIFIIFWFLLNIYILKKINKYISNR